MADVTLEQAEAEEQDQHLKREADRRAWLAKERKSRPNAHSLLHQATKALSEAQRALCKPETEWSDADWEQLKAQVAAASDHLSAVGSTPKEST